MSKTISVIIPAYNVEKYIEKCLQSVLSQTYKELEVIVVNDGSTDDTGDIITKYSYDPRLIFIDQKNQGVTTARNNGINAATGELISFVDSDDWLESDKYEKMYTVMIESKADMAVCDHNLIDKDRIAYKYSGMQDEVVDIIAPDYFLKYCCCPKPNNYLWTRLYKADIIRKSGLRFEKFTHGEDTLFNFKLLPHIKRIANISEGLYNYLQRESSNVQSIARRSNLAAMYADTFDSLVDYYRTNNYEKFLEAMPIHAYTRVRSIFFYSRLAGMDESYIVRNIGDGFKNRKIAEYLRDTAIVKKYVLLNNMPQDMTGEVERIMRYAASKPEKLIGVNIA